MVERYRGMNSNIIIHYFKLRSKQLFRILKELGIIRSLFLSGLLFFSLYGWLYILLFLIALVGALHGNIRIGKIALIVWGIIQTMAFTSIPQRQELTPFPELSNVAEKKLIPTKKYLNPKQTPNFTFSGVKLGAYFVKY